MSASSQAPGSGVEPLGDLASALEREHREIDSGIERFIADLDGAGAAASPEPLVTAMQALRRHIYLEEVFLFPPLRAAGMVMPIMVMIREHGDLWRAMDALDALLADPGAADRIETSCRDLLALLDSHNGKEEPIIYPRTDADLNEFERGQLGQFLAAGHTPDGWVCQGAAH